MLVPDFESKLLMELRPHLLSNPVELDKLDVFIRERAEMVRAGVLRCPTWFQEELNKLDSRSRAWWDAWSERWVLDRLQDEGFYLTYLQFEPRPGFYLDRTLLDMLRSRDMQAKTPAEQMAEKDKAAELRQKANEQANNNAVLARIDKMSSKQIKEFIAVEEAIQSGDKIIAHGESEKILERAKAEYLRQAKIAEERGEQVPTFHDDTRHAINPGHAPHIRRKG